jgi:hypothetical protein
MVTTVDPPVSNPTLALMGWTFPAARGPDVTAALPAVIAVDPHVTTLGWPAALFMHGRWRANADYNLRK